MLKVRIIPCLDTRDGRVVKGIRFASLRDMGDPVEAATRYEDEGADEIVLLDVSATPDGRAHNLDTVERVRRGLRIPLTCGGGVRASEDAQALLSAGADKVAVNTAAVERPEFLTELAERFGRQCVVLALDAALQDGVHRVVVRSGRERTPLEAKAWAVRAEALGAGEILLTSWDRDGTKDGYELELVSAVADAVRCPVIASGGAATEEHFVEGAQAGASALLAASIFHEGSVRVDDLKARLARRGVPVRREVQP